MVARGNIIVSKEEAMNRSNTSNSTLQGPNNGPCAKSVVQLNTGILTKAVKVAMQDLKDEADIAEVCPTRAMKGYALARIAKWPTSRQLSGFVPNGATLLGVIHSCTGKVHEGYPEAWAAVVKWAAENGNSSEETLWFEWFKQVCKNGEPDDDRVGGDEIEERWQEFKSTNAGRLVEEQIPGYTGRSPGPSALGRYGAGAMRARTRRAGPARMHRRRTRPARRSVARARWSQRGGRARRSRRQESERAVEGLSDYSWSSAEDMDDEFSDFDDDMNDDDESPRGRPKRRRVSGSPSQAYPSSHVRPSASRRTSTAARSSRPAGSSASRVNTGRRSSRFPVRRGSKKTRSVKKNERKHKRAGHSKKRPVGRPMKKRPVGRPSKTTAKRAPKRTNSTKTDDAMGSEAPKKGDEPSKPASGNVPPPGKENAPQMKTPSGRKKGAASPSAPGRDEPEPSPPIIPAGEEKWSPPLPGSVLFGKENEPFIPGRARSSTDVPQPPNQHRPGGAAASSSNPQQAQKGAGKRAAPKPKAKTRVRNAPRGQNRDQRRSGLVDEPSQISEGTLSSDDVAEDCDDTDDEEDPNDTYSDLDGFVIDEEDATDSDDITITTSEDEYTGSDSEMEDVEQQ
ncbi:unnamed protein product [Amoebophrya sp. A25]|nr:unnamed protein product [Amoebophrya sp. A25]|eukprot:GSA25T00012927001.1